VCVSGGDRPEVFEFVKETLHKVSLFVKAWVKFRQPHPVRHQSDIAPRTLFGETLAQSIAVVSAVCQQQIDKVFTQYPFFGSRQIAAYLPRKGYHAGRHRIRRLMKIMGLEAIYKRPNTSKKHAENRIYPYLLRNMPITRANQVWCSDISYIPVKRGFLYLVAIMDWAMRIPG